MKDAIHVEPSVANRAASERLGFLDHLRIFAFLSVLIGHALYRPMEAVAQDESLHATLRAMMAMVLPLVRLGGAGVTVFFLVSGYIITRVLRSENPAEFAVKRFFRIYPLYIAAVLALFMLRLLSGQGSQLGQLTMQLTLLGDFTDTPYALGGVEWTLRIEILFYGVMGGLSWLFKRTGSTMGRSAPIVFLAITLLLAASPPLTSGVIGWGHWPATGVINLYFPFLLIGAMVYLHEQGHLGRTALGGFIALVLAQFYWFTPIYQPLWKDDHHAIIALGIFLLAWYFRSLLITTPWVRRLSDMTYPVYLFHNWLYFDLLEQLGRRSGWPEALCVTLSFFILFATCYLASRLVEKPFIALGRKVAARWH